MSENTPIRLTQLTKRGGCASKQPPGNLLPLLAKLPPITASARPHRQQTPRTTPPFTSSPTTRPLVLTTDFFTPVVDGPYDFGAIAAANAISDVYAMAAPPSPPSASSVSPMPTLSLDVLADILRGATDKAAEAGIAIVGGHSIRTDEPIFGLAVVGTVDPRKVLSNAGGETGRSARADQAARPGHHHERGQEWRRQARSHRRSDPRHGHVEQSRLHCGRPCRRQRPDRRDRLRPARTPCET